MNDDIIIAIEKIQKTTAALVVSATEMNSNIKSLSNVAKTILKEIQTFKI